MACPARRPATPKSWPRRCASGRRCRWCFTTKASPASTRPKCCGPPASRASYSANRSMPRPRPAYCRVTSMGLRAKRRRANLAGRLFLFTLGVAALAVAIILALLLLPGLMARQLGPGSPDLNPAEKSVLATYLAAHVSELDAPAGADEIGRASC